VKTASWTKFHEAVFLIPLSTPPALTGREPSPLLIAAENAIQLELSTNLDRKA
jgi:hypothetical protein